MSNNIVHASNTQKQSELFVTPENIRSKFSQIMSDMYKEEVPLYGDLIELVNDINEKTLTEQPSLKKQMNETGELDTLSIERHGAIRLGKPEELFNMRRLFAVMGMHPVGYYDLATAGVPVHSTAFRATSEDTLNRSPFRVFTSLLRLDLISDHTLREQVESILAKRQIFTTTALELITKYEEHGGLTEAEADVFVHEALETFRWHDTSTVSLQMYETLLNQHRLIADVVAFRGPHINHLTPRTLDIDQVQANMLARNIPPKDIIEGPPRRECPILLRQTSFKALTENVKFLGQQEQVQDGEHKARFGEIEQRGVALTQKGQDLYDQLLGETRAKVGMPNAENAQKYYALLSKNFERFPDNHMQMQQQSLAYFYYFVSEEKKYSSTEKVTTADINQLLEDGYINIVPIVYEDFLPVSAAGIFASNLGDDDKKEYTQTSNQELFEKDLGQPVYNLMNYYEELQSKSIHECLLQLNA